MTQQNLESQMEMNPYQSPTEVEVKTFRESLRDFFNLTPRQWAAVATIPIVAAYGIYQILTDK